MSCKYRIQFLSSFSHYDKGILSTFFFFYINVWFRKIKCRHQIGFSRKINSKSPLSCGDFLFRDRHPLSRQGREEKKEDRREYKLSTESVSLFWTPVWLSRNMLPSQWQFSQLAPRIPTSSAWQPTGGRKQEPQSRKKKAGEPRNWPVCVFPGLWVAWGIPFLNKTLPSLNLDIF